MRYKDKKLLFDLLFICFIILLVIVYRKEIISYFDKYFENKEIEVETLDSDVKVYFLDVGQAESILVKNNNSYALIDGGNNLDGKNLVEYLKSLGVSKLDYLIGTHAHEDHIGGFDNIIESFAIEKFYMPKTVVATKSYEDVVKALEKNGIKYNTPKIGTKFYLGDISFEVLSIKDNSEDINNTSIVLKMTYKDISFLFTGDISKDTEDELLDKNIEADVLKVAHHGSVYSNSEKFLEKVNAKYAVIMCGVNNEYYYPHEKVLKRLNNLNTKIYRTDELGTIIFTTDGKNISIDSIKTNINVEEEK